MQIVEIAPLSPEEFVEASVETEITYYDEKPSIAEGTPEQIAFHRQFQSIAQRPFCVTDSASFQTICLYLGEKLLVGYLLSELDDSFIIAFPHLFVQDSTGISAMSAALTNMVRVYKSNFLMSSELDSKHSLFFLECTTARLPDMPGYFNDKRISNIKAVRAALTQELGIDFPTEPGPVASPEQGSPPVVAKNFKAPDYLLNRTKH